MSFFAQCVGAFTALFLTDLCWAIYIEQVKQRNAMNAALWSVFLFGTGAAGVISYTTDPWLLFPAAAGAFFGTLVGVIKNHRDAEKGREA